MSLEKLLVEADVLYAFYSCVSLDFYNFVDQQERISVRQNFSNLPDVKNRVGAELD